MSVCRFSSDDWRSDLYIYESRQGWEVHVAARRHVPRVPLPPPLDFEMVPHDERTIRAWVERSAEVTRIIMAESDLVDIGLPHDGESQTFSDPAAAAVWVEELAALGYCVPDGVVEELREEAR